MPWLSLLVDLAARRKDPISAYYTGNILRAMRDRDGERDSSQKLPQLWRRIKGPNISERLRVAGTGGTMNDI